VAGPFPSANDRKDALEAAFDDRVFSDKKNWEKLKKKYPDLWREQTFSTWGEVKASLPHNVIRELRDKMHFRWKDGSGESVETTVFFDTGNHVGPLLSHIKLESLGCTMGNVDTTDRLAFRGATGEVGFTLGTITLERVQQITTSVKASESAKTFLKFHVWKDPIGLAEIMFGGDENSKFRPGKDGVPPLLCTFPLTTMGSCKYLPLVLGLNNGKEEYHRDRLTSICGPHQPRNRREPGDVSTGSRKERGSSLSTTRPLWRRGRQRSSRAVVV